jgi:hypothetical protein
MPTKCWTSGLMELIFLMAAVVNINVSAENIYAQCDIEGRPYNLMECISDHTKDGHAVEPADMYIKHGSNKKMSKTTKGWHLCVESKDGTTNWERLADLKESNPV